MCKRIALTAYNFFFKAVRAKILAGKVDDSSDEDGLAQDNPESKRIAKEDTSSKSGKVGFSKLGKRVGRRWRRLSTNPLKYFAVS